MSLPVEPSGHRDAAFALARRDGRLLLVQNSRLRWGCEQPTWDLPGGSVRPGEALTLALSREVGEETGLALVGADLRLVVDGAKRRAPGGAPLYTWRAFVFEATTRGEARAGAGIARVGWIDVERAPVLLDAPWHAPLRALLAGDAARHARVDWLEEAPAARRALDARAALGAVVAAGAAGARDLLARSVALALELGAATATVREALLMLVPYAGYPRTLAAFAAARLPDPPAGVTEVDADARERVGRAAFEAVYGSSAARVAQGLGALDPHLPAWTLEHAYGRVLARPGLALRERELLGVSILTALGGLEDALLGHMRGARRLGATPDEVRAMVDAVPLELGEERRERARALLARIDV